MKRFFFIFTFALVATKASAGYCTKIGFVTQCYGDRGQSQTIYNYGHGNYSTQSDDGRGHYNYEGYHVYGEEQEGNDR